MTCAHLLPQYARAQALERDMGAPEDPGSAVSFAQAVALDDAEAAPATACAWLDRWGFPRYYVPARFGGALDSFEELYAMVRVLSRRDYAVVVEHGITFLGCFPVWVAADDALARDVAAHVLGGGRVAMGLTEREHGGDLAACETEARAEGGEYRLSGEKWLINNATRGSAVTLLARTDPRGGPAALSLFHVRRSALAPGAYVPTPRIPTDGVRGVDISGFRVQDARVASGARIGREGRGLDILMKSFQVTRALCAPMAVGCADTALATATRFALGRRLYGGARVVDLPESRAALAGAFADLLAADALGTVCARSIAISPEQMSVRSAVVKYFVPLAAERVVRDAGVVLGARNYLRGEASGIFQKMRRDVALIALFDGSTVVNLRLLAGQLRAVMRHADAAPRDDRAASVRATFALESEVPTFDARRLALLADRDDVLEALAPALQAIAEAPPPGADASAAARIVALGGALHDEWRALAAATTALFARDPRAAPNDPIAFEIARRAAAIYAAAASVALWRETRGVLGNFFDGGAWLASALRRTLATFRPGVLFESDPFLEAVARELEARVAAGTSLTIVPLRHATPGEAPLRAGSPRS